MLFQPTHEKHITPYIFFDIDGVLNKESDWRQQHFSINDACMSVFVNFVNILKDRYNQTPKLITCSTWRAGYNNSNKSGSPTSLLEDTFHKWNLNINGATSISSKTRQEEIEYYIRRHNVQKYIIIDDDESLYYDTSKINLYVPDYRTGLIQDDLKKLEKQFIKYR